MMHEQRLKGLFWVIFLLWNVSAFSSANVVAGEPFSDWVLSPNTDHVRQFMRDELSKNPNNGKLFVLGISDSGKPIEGVEIGSGSVHALIVGTHHGNEYGATEVTKAVLADLLSRPIPDLTVSVIPVLNTSGFDQRARHENGRDPNRDYPGPCGTLGPFRLASTKALAEYVAMKKTVISATMHTFTPAVVYPWGISTRDVSTPYDGLFFDLCTAATVESGYKVGNNTEVLYPADGTFEDYMFWKHGAWSLLFELGHSHRPSYSAVLEMIRVNVPGVRRFLERAPRVAAERHEFLGRCDKSIHKRERLE
jgi:hypothetical protein